MSSTPRTMIAPAASSPATRAAPRRWPAGHHAGEHGDGALRPRPSGTPCCRTSAGESTTSTSGSASSCPSAPHVPRSSSASPVARRWPRPRPSSPRRCTARITKSPMSMTIPGNTLSRSDPSAAARSPRRCRAGAEERRRGRRPARTGRAGAGVRAEIGGHRLAFALREQRLAEHQDRDGPMSRGMPTSANSKNPNGRAAVVGRELRDDDVHRCAGEGEHRCGGRSERERDQQLRGARPSRASTTTTVASAATAPLTVIARSTRRPADHQEDAGTAAPRPQDQRCPAHAVTPVASSASQTTNRDAMNTTVGSPNPASASEA